MKRITFLFLALFMSLSSWADYSGSFGDNLSYLYDGRTQVLTISGTGAMDNYPNISVFDSRPWQEYKENIATVVIEDGVKGIGEGAFKGCENLTSVTIPNTVTSVGDGAFSGCPDALFTISENVKYIGDCLIGVTATDNSSYTIKNDTRLIADGAFSGCSSLTSITIPNSVTSVGGSAFYGCSSLPEEGYCQYADTYLVGVTNLDQLTYTIKEGTRFIGGDAFLDCWHLTSVTIPNSVTSIGGGAFSCCWSLTSVTIPNSVTSIGASAFNGCGFTSITIPNGVTHIGMFAFSNCTCLTSVTIPASVTEISNYAFSGCSSLTSVTCLATNVPVLYPNVFDSSNLTTIYVPAGSVTDYKKATNWNTYESIIHAGGYCGENLTWNYADGTLTISGTGAMSDYDNNSNIAPWSDITSSITSINIGDNVTSIGVWTFTDCQDLTSVNIPASVTSIGGYAFKGCTRLESVTFANDSQLASIGENAFMECSSLISVNIPASVTGIGDYAFSDCPQLATVTFAAGSQLQTIGSNAFSYCSSLSSITIPESVTSIANHAFSACPKPTSITIPALVTSIGASAFENCTGLTTVTIGKSVNSIGLCAFGGCVALETITVDGDNQTYDSRDNCNAIIEKSTNTLITGCKSTTIPEGVTSIGALAFFMCSSLISVTCLATAPPTLYSNVFYECFKLTTIYVPARSYTAYMNSWSDYSAKIQADPHTSIPTVTLNGAGMATYSVATDVVITTEGVKAYKAAVEGETITLTELTGYIPAGTGVLLYKEDGNGTTVEFAAPTTESKADVTGNDFLPTTLANGSLADIPGTGTVWALKGNEFLNYNGTEFTANRAYLVKSSSAKEMTIVFDSETTGIRKPNAVRIENPVVESYYNLAGQKVSADYKGIVIVNGKTMLKK